MQLFFGCRRSLLDNVISDRERSMGCDYNGWADVPEEEREAIDEFEVAQSVRFTRMRLWLMDTTMRQVTMRAEQRVA